LSEIVTSVASAFLGSFVGAASALAIEKYRSKLEDRARYNQWQFKIYKSLWGNLYDLQVSADELWNEATNETLEAFADQLEKTKTVVGQNKPFIEEKHRKELDSLIEAFENFEFHKEKLIDLKKRLEYRNVPMHEIREVIAQNRQTRDKYNELVKQLEISIRNQLRTP
jgi:gas vesicle protein